MKFSTSFIIAASAFLSTVSAGPYKRDASDADIERLAPPLGFTAGRNPTGTGDCDGAVNGADGKPIKIPCACPPSNDVYLSALKADVHAGHAINNPSVAVSFPTDNSKNSQLARINAAAIALQNLNGPGKGCPFVSTTLGAQQAAIQAGTAPPPPAAAPPPPPPAAAPPPPANNNLAAQVAQLAPDLGFTAGRNPTGTGDCDGAVNGADGKPIKIPCACPPSRDAYIAALTADVLAGHAVNNPSVQVSFPTDNSKNSQLARINAAAIALQNLNGPGKGCPFVSTTLGAQQTAIQNGTPPPPPAAAAPPPPPPPAAAPPPPPAGNSLAAQVAQLAPDLGFTAGRNPTGTGDCDGAVNGADGKPIKIPCSCPPSRDAYVAALTADVLAGHAVNNPSVQVSFPTDNSKASKLARINAAAIALQNLNGPGKGCPFVSTTLGAQQTAIQNS